MKEEITVMEFRANETLRKKAATILEHPDIQLILDTVVCSSPERLMNHPVTADDKIMMLGEVRGYQKCLNNIRSLGTAPKIQKQVQATYKEPKL